MKSALLLTTRSMQPTNQLSMPTALYTICPGCDRRYSSRGGHRRRNQHNRDSRSEIAHDLARHELPSRGADRPEPPAQLQSRHNAMKPLTNQLSSAIQPFFLKSRPSILKTSFAARKSEAIFPGSGQSSTTSKPTTLRSSITRLSRCRV